jgi:hypothetical protein
MRKLIGLVAAMVLLTGVAFASVRPSELNGVINAPKPYGTASLTWLFLTAYDASLWTDAPQWSMNDRFALTIAYKMSFTREELVESTIEEMQKVAPGLSRETLAQFASSLAKAYPNVKSGDRITALHEPGKPVRLFHNGTMTSQIDDPGFAEPFFGIWLSPRTSEPSVRAGLLRLRG